MAKTFVLHDESINSQGFWMLTDGCDLTQFERNPIMLWNHNSAWGDTRESRLPIGHWENVRVKGKQILADPVFDSDDFSQTIAKKVESGTLRMASVGAVVIESSEDKKHIKAGQRYATVLKWKLKEASIVNIGANDNALVAFYDDAGAMLTLSDASKNPLKPLNIRNSMNKELLRVLNLSDGADESAVVLAVTKLKDEFNKLKSVTEAKALADKEAAKALFATEVKQAIKDGRMSASGEADLLELYDEKPETAARFLSNLPKRKAVVEEIDKNKGGNDKELADLQAKTWDDLDKEGKLITLRDKYPDTYKDKFKAKFGKEPNI